MMSSWFAGLGAFRTLPLFFAIGAGVEWFMIHVQIGKETFYDTLVRKEAERRAVERKQSQETPAAARDDKS